MIWPPTPLAISVLLGILFLSLTIIRRGIPKFNEGQIFSYVYNAFSISFLIGHLFFPAIWTTAAFMIRGGTMEENLYPGAAVGSLMFWTFVSSLIATGVVLFRFYLGLNQASPAMKREHKLTGRGYSCSLSIHSAAFSAIIMVVAFVLARTTSGMTEASTTLSP